MNNQPNVQVQPSGAGTVRMAVAAQGGSFILAIVGGLIAAIIGAAIWGGYFYVISQQSSTTVNPADSGSYLVQSILLSNKMGALVAVIVGLIVGLAVRTFGRGTSIPYGIIGGLFALLALVAGTLFGLALYLANDPQYGLSLTETLNYMLSNLGTMLQLLQKSLDPIFYLFFLVAVIEAALVGMGRILKRRR